MKSGRCEKVSTYSVSADKRIGEDEYLLLNLSSDKPFVMPRSVLRLSANHRYAAVGLV